MSLQDARSAVSTSDQFALSYLALCLVSYAKEGNRAAALAAIPERVTALGSYVPYPGKWSLLWGPAATSDNSNLMFAAAYNDLASGAPIYAAVVIRGTDTGAGDDLALFQQIHEDLDAGHQAPWPYPNPHNDGSVRVANGTLYGLQKRLLTLTDPHTDETIDTFISNYMAANSGVPLVVTGHSLGGCQTTVMALYLASVLPPGTTIVPNSIAAPTAGNEAFAAMYQATFPYAPRWYNTYDLVPMAYANLNAIRSLWSQCDMPMTDVLKLALDAIELDVRHGGYCQAGLPARPLQGSCMPSTSENYNWGGQLIYQHFPNSGYLNAMATTPGVLPFPWPPVPAKKGSSADRDRRS